MNFDSSHHTFNEPSRPVDGSPSREYPRGEQWAHPCGCFLFNGGLDFCQHGNRYDQADPPYTDPATKMQRLEAWLRSKGVTESG